MPNDLKEADLANEIDLEETVVITNPLNEDFIHPYKGKPYLIPANSAKPMVGYLARHMAKHLAIRIIVKGGRFKDKMVREGVVKGKTVSKTLIASLAGKLIEHESTLQHVEKKIGKELGSADDGPVKTNKPDSTSPEKKDADEMNVDECRAFLKDNGVKFYPNTGLPKLREHVKIFREEDQRAKDQKLTPEEANLVDAAKENKEEGKPLSEEDDAAKIAADASKGEDEQGISSNTRDKNPSTEAADAESKKLLQDVEGAKK